MVGGFCGYFLFFAVVLFGLSEFLRPPPPKPPTTTWAEIQEERRQAGKAVYPDDTEIRWEEE